MPVQLNDPAELNGQQVVGSDGEKIGKVENVYLDNETSRPEWAAVKSGMFGGHVSLVPLAEADYDGEQLRVPYDKARLKDAPHHDPGRELSVDDESQLYEYYGMSYGTQAPRAGEGVGREQTTDRGRGHDTSGANTDDDAMTRSEEQLDVGTQSQEVGRARLRKHVVTENVTQTVPVSHEELRVEREPITDANRDQAMSGGDITEEEHEVTLNAERPVVAKETVPVERVRLAKETVRGEETVNESVRKEQIDEPETDRQRSDREK